MSLRSQLGVDDQDWFPIVEILDLGLGQQFPDYFFDVLEPELMGEDHGLTIPDEGIIFIREDVYCGARLGKGRDRFTCTHEFSHLVLHQGISLARASVEEVWQHEVYEDSEWQANTLASELMMPVPTVQRYPRGTLLMNRCGVSRNAADVRIRVLQMEGLL